jgi:hypothetical protein
MSTAGPLIEITFPMFSAISLSIVTYKSFHRGRVHTPGAEAPILAGLKIAKAEALAYLEAKPSC